MEMSNIKARNWRKTALSMAYRFPFPGIDRAAVVWARKYQFLAPCGLPVGGTRLNSLPVACGIGLASLNRERFLHYPNSGKCGKIHQRASAVCQGKVRNEPLLAGIILLSVAVCSPPAKRKGLEASSLQGENTLFIYCSDACLTQKECD